MQSNIDNTPSSVGKGDSTTQPNENSSYLEQTANILPTVNDAKEHLLEVIQAQANLIAIYERTIQLYEERNGILPSAQFLEEFAQFLKEKQAALLASEGEVSRG